MGKRINISAEDYDIMLSCLPPEGETITPEEFEERWQYEFGRRDAIKDSANPEFLKVMLGLQPTPGGNLVCLDALGAAWAKGYRDYANAWLVINRI